ncbi:MAG: HAD family hydrolase [Halobacteriaceae archaeon]
MDTYDRLYALYQDHDTGTLRAYQEVVDLFPPVDSRMALDQWRSASEELETRKERIAGAMPVDGERFADIAALATREQAFTALDLYTKYDRGVGVLVLDVDETLRSAGTTDNEIPRETLHLLTRFHETGVPVVICTGQTLENVKGFLIQGLGNELVHSGRLSIVYEAGTGVFTPGHGAETKQLLYETLDDTIRTVFTALRSEVLSRAPRRLREGCHLQGNEFNVTLKPNFQTGTTAADEIIDDGLVYLLDLLESCVSETLEVEPHADGIARAFYAAADPEIDAVVQAADDRSIPDPSEIRPSFRQLFERIDVAYYEGDAAEIGSRELNKVVGVDAAFDVLDIEDPFALVMGDSKSDLRVMRWVAENDMGIGAAPEHASTEVLEHVRATDELIFDPGDAGAILRTAYAMRLLARIS